MRLAVTDFGIQNRESLEYLKEILLPKNQEDNNKRKKGSLKKLGLSKIFLKNKKKSSQFQLFLDLDLPVPLLLCKHLMVGELAVEVLSDVVDPARVPLLAGQLRVQALVLVPQIVPATQVEPGPRSHRRRDALTAALANLGNAKRKY